METDLSKSDGSPALARRDCSAFRRPLPHHERAFIYECDPRRFTIRWQPTWSDSPDGDGDWVLEEAKYHTRPSRGERIKRKRHEQMPKWVRRGAYCTITDAESALLGLLDKPNAQALERRATGAQK